MAVIAVDTSQWPRVLVGFPGLFSEQDFRDYLVELTQVVQRGARVLVIDTRRSQTPDAAQRAQLMTFARTNWRALTQVRALFFVIDSAIARGAVTALSWTIQKPCPVVIVRTLAEVDHWLAKHPLRQRKVA